jgi:hypothetical protein
MSEWDRRQLCPDGGCVGVIGPDGRCKVCGRVAPNWGDERNRGLNADDEDEDDDAAPAAPVDAIAPSAPVALGTAGEWAKRQLCGDGSCIGVIGASGRCKVCGRTLAESTAGAPPTAPPPADPDEVEGDDDDDALADDDSEDVLDEDEAHDDDDDDVHDDEDEEAELAAAAADLAAVAVADADDELATRSLCPDGACVGVIGSDGRCKVCGKEAA